MRMPMGIAIEAARRKAVQTLRMETQAFHARCWSANMCPMAKTTALGAGKKSGFVRLSRATASHRSRSRQLAATAIRAVTVRGTLARRRNRSRAEKAEVTFRSARPGKARPVFGTVLAGALLTEQPQSQR